MTEVSQERKFGFSSASDSAAMVCEHDRPWPTNSLCCWRGTMRDSTIARASARLANLS